MKIEKNVPIPRRGYEMPFDQMEVGDSFVLPDSFSPGYARALIRKAQKSIGRKFTLRKIGDSFRCWRIE
jgi:hypothetical protein